MDRIALVIGNSDYSNVGKLNNPKNDADDIASILNKLNFDVTKIMDANLIDIQKSVNDFLQALDEYAVGVFFYAGHGMQIDGKNFIVPIDLKLSDKSKTMVSCYCLNSLLEGASSYKGKTLICILDACRDNPFAMGRGFLTGFAPFNNPPNVSIITTFLPTGNRSPSAERIGLLLIYWQKGSKKQLPAHPFFLTRA